MSVCPSAKRILFVLIFVVSFFLARQKLILPALAQQKTNQASNSFSPEAQAILQSKLRTWLDSLEERAHKTMGQQLSDGRYLLYAKADVNVEKFMAIVNDKNSDTRLTTLPIDVTASEKQKIAAEALSVEKISLIAGPITFTLTFDSDIPTAQAAALKDAVADALGLKLSSGDKIVVKRAPLAASTTSKKIESLSSKVEEGSKDVEKLRFETSLAQQKISQVEAERLKLQNDLLNAQEKISNTEKAAQEKIALLEERLAEEKEKAKRLEEELSIYKTPLGEFKKIIKGLELPLTVLPIALFLFVFAAIGFFLHLRLQNTKNAKFMQATETMAQALVKAGRSGAGQGMTLDAARAELSKLTSTQNEEAAAAQLNEMPQALLGEELVAARQEAIAAWNDLKKYPYLTFAELREWLVGGGRHTQRFISLVSALGPVESMRLLQLFSHEDLEKMRDETHGHASKLPGYVALLELHRNVSAEAMRRPDFIAKLNFPELVRASDEALARALEKASPIGIALCINLLPNSRKSRIFEAFSTEYQRKCVDGVAALEDLETQEIETQLASLKEKMESLLELDAAPRVSAAEDIAKLLEGISPKARSFLQESLNRHQGLRNKVTQKMITFDDVLAIEDETLAELLDEFDPEQLATLVSGLSQNDQKRVSQVLSRKVIIGMQSEMQRLASRPATLRRAQTQSVNLQAYLIDKLKVLVNEGAVELQRKELPLSGVRKVGESA